MIGVLSRIAGPKVLLGVLIAAGLAIAWLWWSYSDAAAEANAAHARAEQAQAAAKANAEAAQAARMERQLLDDVLTDRAERERKLKRELADTHDRLKEARANASQETRDCMRRRLPSDYLRELRPQDGNQGGASQGGATGEPDAADSATAAEG